MYSRIHIRIRHPVLAIRIVFVTWCIRSSPSVCSLCWFIFLKVLGSDEDSALEEEGEKPAKKKKTDGSAKISTRASYSLIIIVNMAICLFLMNHVPIMYK